jgi:hypothetical protein
MYTCMLFEGENLEPSIMFTLVNLNDCRAFYVLMFAVGWYSSCV